MYCPGCGTVLNGGENSCPVCGTQINGVGNNNNVYSTQKPMYNTASTPNYGLYLGLSIFQLLCCCLVTGILGIVMTIQFDGAYKNGDMQKYESSKKSAKICLIIGFILPVVIFVLTFATGMLGIFTSALGY